MNRKVLLGMSGGVDSSVAAILLQKEGWEVIGCTMRLHTDPPDAPPREGGCCSFRDVQDARMVCYQLGIDHLVFNFTEIFTKSVIENFASEYEKGRTPNPCIRCNRFLKMGAMLQRARELGIDHIATGHYALTGQLPNGRYYLKAAPTNKDQSYVLYCLEQGQLQHLLLPLGNYTKPQIRAIAEEAGLRVAHKPDSQEICFVEDNDYHAFLKRYRGHDSQPGDFIDREGNVLGHHLGLTHYTVGQRKGLGISFGQPMYVDALIPSKNQVVLGPEGTQYRSFTYASEVNWVSIEKLEAPIHAQVKIRYQARPAGATITPEENDTVRVDFDEPQRAVTPGQAVVFYDSEGFVLGGGLIFYPDEK
mgnify:FL=1